MELQNQNSSFATIGAQNLKEREYWKNILNDDINKEGFFVDKLDEKEKSNIDFNEYSFKIENELFLKLLKISNNSENRLFVVLAGALFGLLYKYTDKNDLILGTTIHEQETELNLINKILVLRNSFEGNDSFKELLMKTKKVFFDCLENQNYPLEIFSEKISNLEVGIILNNIHKKEYFGQFRPHVLFEFTLESNCIKGVISYNKSLYFESTIKDISDQYLMLLEESLNDANKELAAIDIIDENEKIELIQNNIGSIESNFSEKSIIELFEKQVTETPNEIALVFNGKSLTYNEVNTMSNQMARMIRNKNYKDNSVVALVINRSFEQIVTILAVFKAKMVYLPIAPNTPEKRVQYILENSEAKMIISYEEYFNGLELLKDNNIDIIVLNEDLWNNEDNTNLNLIHKKNDITYIIYTSGSTGKPKGVLINNGNISNTIQWFGKEYSMDSNKRVIQLSNYIFDPSIEQIFGTMCYGGVLFLPENELLSDLADLRAYIETNKINTINFTPKFLHQLLCEGEKIECMDVVIAGGEKLDEFVKNDFLEKGYELYNHYGPTEVAIDALSEKCSNSPVRLGKPIANTRAFVLDSNLNPKPNGVPGKLYIAGSGVASGYLKNEKLTNLVFVDNPFDKGEKMYDTGDIVKWNKEGQIEFIGRKDNQIKIRGYRIEIEEIENVLCEIEDVLEAVVLPVNNIKNETYLSAFIVTSKKVDSENIRFIISKKLPHYMTPAFVNQVDSIPRNANGKIDRNQIKDLDIFKSSINRSFKSPETDLEIKISDIWKEVLSIEKLSVNENFFELGGNSMNIIQMCNMLNEQLSENLSVVNIFDNPTVESIAVFLKGKVSESQPDNENMKTSSDRMKKSILKMKGKSNVK